MRTTLWGLVLLLSASAPVAAQHQYVLRSTALRVGIDLTSGKVAELRDLHYPDSSLVFGATDEVLRIAAGDLQPASFQVTGADANSVTLASSEFRGATGALPLRTTIRYRLAGNRLAIDYRFEALGRSDLASGLDVSLSSSVWDTIAVRNHYSGEAPFVLSRSNPVRRLALNQVYEFHSSLRKLSFVFANPYHSLVTISPTGPHAFQFKWHVLASTVPPQAVEPKGPPLASVLGSGVELHRQLEIIVAHSDETPPGSTGPIAYFSPWPSGYDQVLAMTFDDIPFGRWVYATSSHDANAPVEASLVRLLEDHPRMKMGWVVLPDAIFSADGIANPDYPTGKWWDAHGTHRILTAAPEIYRQWLRNIDRDSLVFGYEGRVHLGSHGYHHTPEMLFGGNFEFQSYDPERNDSTFAAICKEYSLLGLQAKSCRWIRFPGFFFTRSAVDALIKYEFVLFDYWGIYDKLPWMQFYSEHGRIWGTGTMWEGDTPSSYDVMDKILRAGKLCHTSGHPKAWFDGDLETAYQQISQEFSQAESNFPNLGYLFPDEVGSFANETGDIRDIRIQVASDAVVMSFIGAAARGQTIMVEWPSGCLLPDSMTIDGLGVSELTFRGRRLVVELPALAEGAHTAQFLLSPGELTPIQVAPSKVVLSQNYPNPFNAGTAISYYLPRAAHVTLAIYSVAGERVAMLMDREQPRGDYSVHWDGRGDAGAEVASGIYFYRLEVGRDTRVRKMVLVR